MKRTPRRASGAPTNLTLTRLESFVLDRVDGQLSERDLADLTGLAAPQLEQILQELASRGAIELDESTSEPRLDELLEQEPLPQLEQVLEVIPGAIPEPPDSWVADQMPREAASDEPADEAKTEPSFFVAEDLGAEEGSRESEVQNHRKLFETELRHLPLSERIDLARRGSGATLMALTFDQDVEVIKGLLVNDRLSLDHARLVAANHRNPVGLEALTRRVSILRDARVERMLLRNVQLTEALLKRILNPKRLLEIYKASMDRDVPDRTRANAKALFKDKFAVGAPEEKFELIWNTEGRVLPALLGQTLDQKTTALFCARPITSVMLIQAFCRFPGTPPAILAHILKQPVVRRQPHLRTMALQHPNVPSEAKRSS